MFDAGPLPYEPLPAPQRPARRELLKDRLKALCAFSGIAIGAVAGLEMVIGGGFDFITPAPEVREVAPSSYVTVYRAPWSPEIQVVALSSTEPLFAGEAIPITTTSARLAGGYDDAAAPEMAYPEIDEAELRRQIDDLYAGDTGPTYTEASIAYEDAPAIDAPRAGGAPAVDPYAEAEAMVREALGDYRYDGPPLHPS